MALGVSKWLSNCTSCFLFYAITEYMLEPKGCGMMNYFDVVGLLLSLLH